MLSERANPKPEAQNPFPFDKDSSVECFRHTGFGNSSHENDFPEFDEPEPDVERGRRKFGVPSFAKING